MIYLQDKTFERFISSKEIKFAIKNMAKQMDDDFFEEVPIFIGVLNGSFAFLSELVKRYKGNCEVDFVKVASYDGTVASNKIEELIGITRSLEGRTVVIVEDIVDTGATILHLKELLKKQKVKYLKVATLFLKPEVYKKEVKLDYVGMRIPNQFVVGFGMDYNGLGRNLKDVYQLVEK
jgi:hypoxanthine phosphoribosyltransferase